MRDDTILVAQPPPLIPGYEFVGFLGEGGLAQAACAPLENKPAGSMEEHAKEPAVFLTERRDGLLTATLMLNGYVHAFAYDGRVDGQVLGSEFYLQNEGPFGHFGYLCRNIQQFFLTGRAPSARRSDSVPPETNSIRM